MPIDPEFIYRRPKFLEVLLDIRREMAREADYDVDLFVEMARSGKMPPDRRKFDLGDRAKTPKRTAKKPAKKPVGKDTGRERT